MLVSPGQILPSQDYLKPQTVSYILGCFDAGNLDELPPDPIVRKDNDGNLIAIDGHNLIAVMCWRHENVNVHLATSADDGLPPTSDANIQRNQDLKAKYDTVLEDRIRLHEQGIDSFNVLIAKHPEHFQVN